jgi:membrane protein implicated in regulation of membrane protease activity
VPDWVIWAIVAGALAAGEMLTLSFFLGPLALAAAAAAVVAVLGGGIALQLLVFIAAALASLLFLRPVVRRHLRTSPALRTGTAALVGGSAVVLSRVDADGGQVRIGGEVWSARAYDDGGVYDEGRRVTVLEIQGATALVSD